MLDQSPTFGDSRLPTRFWAKVNENGPIPAHRPDLGPCWQWTAARTSHGYGSFMAGSRRDGTYKIVCAHRWIYEQLIGPFPVGLEPDHLCRNRACVLPAHMEPVTRRENILRGASPIAEEARAEACPQGHPYDEINTYRDRDGGRSCRLCRAAARQRWRAKSVKTLGAPRTARSGAEPPAPAGRGHT